MYFFVVILGFVRSVVISYELLGLVWKACDLCEGFVNELAFDFDFMR